jgi:hypothetical protein
MIEEDLNRVEKSATKSTYKLGVGFDRCEDKGKKVLPSLFLDHYHKEEEALKPTKTHYPSNPKPSFNPKSGVKKNTLKPCEDYARNSYHDEFTDFLPHFSSRAPSSFSQ